MLLPLVQLGVEAFWTDDRLDFDPILELFSTSSQWSLLLNSLMLASGASVVAIVIGVPYALLCEKSSFWGRSFFKVAYLVPLLIPPYMQAIVWSQLLAKNGSVNTFLVDALNLTQPLLSAYSLTGAIIVFGLAYFPFVTLITISGLKSVDREFEEAALLQQKPKRSLIYVTLPLVFPHIIAGTVFVFIFSIIDFSVPDILRVKVYPVEIFVQFSAFYNEKAAIVLGLPLLVITTLMVSLQAWVMRGRSYVSFSNDAKGLQSYFHEGYRWWLFAFCAVVVGMTVLIPVGVLLEMAGPLATYQKALSTSWEQIAYSFTLAVIGAAVMTLLAFLVAYTVARGSPKTRNAGIYLTQLPFAIPPILLGLALIKIWNRPWIDWVYGSSMIILIGYLAHFVPFTIRAVYASLQQLNPQLEEVGCLLSKSRMRVMGLITIPMIKNGLVVGFFISFVLAFSELGVTLLVIPPGKATIPIKIYNFMHYGAEHMVAALCLILLIIQMLFSAGLLWLFNRTKDGVS